jgi:hypothetical protein
MPKLKCLNCGEVFESGIERVLEHQFETCGAIYEEKISDGVSVSVKPFLMIEVLNDEDGK